MKKITSKKRQSTIGKIKSKKKHSQASKRNCLTQLKYNINTFFNHKMSRSMIACGGFWKTISSGSFMCKKAPVTGRHWLSYAQHLFGDIPREQLFDYLAKRHFLDMGSGLNHIYKDALLYKVIKYIKTGKTTSKATRKTTGMDIHPFPNSKHFQEGSIYKTGLKSNSYDVITSQYLVYYWIDNIQKLKQLFKEMHRILKKRGQFRIYPVYHGDYHYNNKELMAFIHKHFKVETYQPTFYIKERVRYIDANDIDLKNPKNNEKIAKKKIKITPYGVTEKESEDHHNLNAHTLILIKK